MIPIYEAGEHDGRLYLAMRFVDGSDMEPSCASAERVAAPEHALDILDQVAGALDAAHRRALVHRDVKPANVLVDENGHAYLTDFGVTKQLGGNTTDTGHIVGTLDYVAPEQIRGDHVDGRADGYALGCVLYECLSGAPPFQRATEAETLWAHMQEPPPPLTGHPALDPVMVKALAKDPADRYATCGELIADARAALAHPIVVRRGCCAAATRSSPPVCWCSLRPPSRSCWHRARAALPRYGGRFWLRATGSPPSAWTGRASPVDLIRHGAEQHRKNRRGQRLGADTVDDRVSRVDPRAGNPLIRAFKSRRRPSTPIIAAGAGDAVDRQRARLLRIARRGSIPPRERRPHTARRPVANITLAARAFR